MYKHGSVGVLFNASDLNPDSRLFWNEEDRKHMLAVPLD